MNANTETNPGGLTSATVLQLLKADPAAPALRMGAENIVLIKAGTIFGTDRFDVDTEVAPPEGGYRAGGDYGVMVGGGIASAVLLDTSPEGATPCLGGFHFAPGGNASARAGGDTVPAINPFSLWDVSFRPVCPDPRGMALIDGAGGKFWADIYLLGRDHLAGTSRLGMTIADGDDPPQRLDGDGTFDGLDYETAIAVLAHHGKQLLSYDEFRAAAYGVTERTSCDEDPKVTKLDAARTSRSGLMQATGNLWTWGHDGDPDDRRASVFGGYWWYGDHAGSRHASLDYWPGDSHDNIGARGRCDHLQPE